MKTVVIDKTLVKKVLETVDAGLVSGLGEPIPGQMCIEAAICYALGEPHGDNPSCVAASVRRIKIRLNDARWSSNKARTKGLRKIAVAQLGSFGTINEKEFLSYVAEQTIRRIVPLAMHYAALKNPKMAVELEEAGAICKQQGTRSSARAANKIAFKAYAAYAYAAAAAAAAAADAAAAAADADAADAAAAAADAADAADAAGKTDEPLIVAAQIVLEGLQRVNSPGCKFLHLVK